MYLAIEAEAHPNGTIVLRQPFSLPGVRRAVLIVLDEPPPAKVAFGEKSTIVRDPTVRDGGIETTGQEWRGEYEQLEILGRGGMGIVYRVQSRTSGKQFALKELFAHVNRSSLRQECKALIQLRHPGIVAITHFDVETQNPYYVAELLRGPTLATLMKDSVSPAEAVSLGCQLFSALAYAHSKGVIHRDLKPHNVAMELPERPFQPKILDFGLAVVDLRDADGRLTAEGVMAGTPIYMSPEQIRMEQLTPACDVYAFGQILWELLEGQRAFSGNDLPAIIYAKMELQDGLVLKPYHSESLRRLIKSCTQLQADRRPSADQVVQRLVEIGDDLQQMT